MIQRTIPLVSVMLVLMAALLSGGCTDEGGADEGTVEGTVEGVGTVLQVNGSSTYVIQTADGTRYVPVNLDENYRVDGRVIYFRGVVPEDGRVSETSGIPLEIRDIGTYVPPGSNATITFEKI